MAVDDATGLSSSFTGVHPWADRPIHCWWGRQGPMVADQGQTCFSLPTTQGAAPKFLDTLVSVGLATHE
jgi:hypothetical protein